MLAVMSQFLSCVFIINYRVNLRLDNGCWCIQLNGTFNKAALYQLETNIEHFHSIACYTYDQFSISLFISRFIDGFPYAGINLFSATIPFGTRSTHSTVFIIGRHAHCLIILTIYAIVMTAMIYGAKRRQRSPEKTSGAS